MSKSVLPHRIGDLENYYDTPRVLRILPHRIGDLEIANEQWLPIPSLPHRIGDLEMLALRINK